MQAQVPKLDLCGCYEDSTSTQSIEKEWCAQAACKPHLSESQQRQSKNFRQQWTTNPTSQNGEKNSENLILQQRSPPVFPKP